MLGDMCLSSREKEESEIGKEFNMFFIVYMTENAGDQSLNYQRIFYLFIFLDYKPLIPNRRQLH